MNSNQLTLKNFILQIIAPYRRYVLVLGMIALVWGLFNSLAPYILKLVIDKAVAFQDNRMSLVRVLLPYIALYIAIWIVLAVGMRTLDWVKLWFFPSVREAIIARMFAYLNQHSYRYFQNHFAGSLCNKISDMHASVVAMLSTLDDAFAQMVGLCIAITVMLLVHPLFALILFAWAISFLLIAYLFFHPIQKLSHVFAASRTLAFGKMVDSISNMVNVRLFARQPYENRLTQEATADVVAKDRDMQRMIIKMRVFWDLSIIVLLSVNLLVLAHMYAHNRVTVGDFSFIISLSMNIFFNLWFVASQFVLFAEDVGRCNQALTILSMPHEIEDSSQAKELVVTAGRIEFNQVTFHYDEGAHLFKNKNIVIDPGQKVGLVGFSGSGKSTFVHLILRLFEVESGKILIDNQNIRQVTQASLRANIAMIPQDITLFHRSLLDNIRYGCPEASDEAVIEASKKAHCHEFVKQLPDGYATLVGERGIKLSGGQRQRIAIARAMLKNASILLLDEATSALDSVTEKYIQESLHQLMAGKTTIVIAHRLSTLSEMDRILVFDQGQVIEDGTHAQLMETGGHYAKMWAMQAGGFLPEM